MERLQFDTIKKKNLSLSWDTLKLNGLELECKNFTNQAKEKIGRE